MRSWLISITGGSLVLLALFAEPHAAFQQRPGATADGDWPMYRHDRAGTGASPLTQIDAGNVARLRQAWTYGLASDTPTTGRGAAGPNSEATPIVVNGLVYLPGANRVVALDPETGRNAGAMLCRAALHHAAASRSGLATARRRHGFSWRPAGD
jgi:glucose dehydrogenase